MKTKFIDHQSGFALDISGLRAVHSAPAEFFNQFKKVSREMQKIESGEIKNPDENRQVTHFADRIAYPSSPLFAEVEQFADNIRHGRITGGTGRSFKAVVVNGIGGSALGPQLVNFALNGPYWNELSAAKRRNWLKIYFTDNTDSSGITDVLNVVDLEETIILSISKSGGTRETYNNMKAFEQVYTEAGLNFSEFATAITMVGSKLDKYAEARNWLKRFPMAESIGGRTSETSIVGHLPAALAGIDFSMFLKGAVYMDQVTRAEQVEVNPAYMLAACWYAAGNGKGDKNMVIVPYSDRLVLLSRYLQQLVMESLGKALDLDGNVVHQGINVFGNKGGTDAHAFIQQLNDGRNDFFITFIEVLKDSRNFTYDDGFSMGDYLHGFKDGLSNALRSKAREVIEIEITDINEFNLGMVIALYERAVAAYAELIHINAFHQPGVQAYKLAAGTVIDLYSKLKTFFTEHQGFSGSAAVFAEAVKTEAVKDVTGILNKMSFNTKLVERQWSESDNDWKYRVC